MVLRNMLPANVLLKLKIASGNTRIQHQCQMQC